MNIKLDAIEPEGYLIQPKAATGFLKDSPPPINLVGKEVSELATAVLPS